MIRVPVRTGNRLESHRMGHFAALVEPWSHRRLNVQLDFLREELGAPRTG
ncbi:MAG: hypothetical protein JSU98_06160 [Gemmatimonadales bacterium]|nr:MAG: hypothetical protein JSU98_06160 [Gemmatimonadales bacterium]